MKKQERQLKIGYKFQNRAYRQLVAIPEIKLSGKWLKESGFYEGQEVKIIVENGKLVIVPKEKGS
jgi:toxic protein SymE